MNPKTRARLRLAAEGKCSICRASGIPLDIHHKDRNRANNDDSNLQVLCRTCHQSVHKNLTWSDELNTWDTPFAREKALRNDRWFSGAKETISITVDAAALKELRALARDAYGTEDVGRLISDSRLHVRNGSLGTFTEEYVAREAAA